MKLDAGTCKFCGQAIFWAVLPSGKKAPLDPECFYVLPPNPDGELEEDPTPALAKISLVLVGTGEQMRGVEAMPPLPPEARAGYTNHWSTCPQWRQAKAAKLAKQPPWREQVRSMRAEPCPKCKARGEHAARCTPWGPHWGEVLCFSCKRHLQWLPKPPEADLGAWALYRRSEEHWRATGSKTPSRAGGPT